MNDPSLLVLRVPCWLQKGTKRRKAGQHSQPCEERLAPHESCCSGKNVGPGVLRPGREASLGLSLLNCHGGLWYPSVHYLDLGMGKSGTTVSGCAQPSSGSATTSHTINPCFSCHCCYTTSEKTQWDGMRVPEGNAGYSNHFFRFWWFHFTDGELRPSGPG